jgi:hypothetical protein
MQHQRQNRSGLLTGDADRSKAPIHIPLEDLFVDGVADCLPLLSCNHSRGYLPGTVESELSQSADFASDGTSGSPIVSEIGLVTDALSNAAK